jgi:hypothetical protein
MVMRLLLVIHPLHHIQRQNTSKLGAFTAFTDILKLCNKIINNLLQNIINRLLFANGMMLI